MQLLSAEVDDESEQEEKEAKEDAPDAQNEVDGQETNEPTTEGLYFFDTTTVSLPH